MVNSSNLDNREMVKDKYSLMGEVPKAKENSIASIIRPILFGNDLIYFQAKRDAPTWNRIKDSCIRFTEEESFLELDNYNQSFSNPEEFAKVCLDFYDHIGSDRWVFEHPRLSFTSDQQDRAEGDIFGVGDYLKKVIPQIQPRGRRDRWSGEYSKDSLKSWKLQKRLVKLEIRNKAKFAFKVAKELSSTNHVDESINLYENLGELILARNIASEYNRDKKSEELHKAVLDVYKNRLNRSKSIGEEILNGVKYFLINLEH